VRRFYSRVYLHLLLAIIVSLVAALAISALGYRGEFRRGIGHRLAMVAASLVAEHFDDPQERAHLVDHLASELGVELTLRDLDGDLLAASGEPHPPLGRDELASLRNHERGFMHPGRPFAAALVRPPGRAEPAAVLVAAAPHGLPPALTQLFASILAVLAIIALLAWPLARRVSRPVERLTEATLRFGRGELGHRIDVPSAGPHGPDELARLELAWNEMATRIESLVRSHRELLANVSHELRSPLARLRLVLELLPGHPEVRARTAEIERELADLDRLVDGLLTVARLEAAALPVARTSVDAAALLSGVAARGAEDPRLCQAEVRLDVAPVAVSGDEALLRRALWNLLENAAKYGASPITLFAREDGARVWLGVEDAGPGIPAEERAKVQAPFVRGGAGERDGGFGLGLTLASRVALAHGGELRLEALEVEDGVERGLRVSLSVTRA
jgi:two-component system OmpR family sensor kinase